MAPCGAIPVSALVDATMLLDNHGLVGMVMAPAFVPPAITMHAEFGTRAKAMLAEFGARTEAMITEVPIVLLDHDGFSACNRRRSNSDRAEGCNNVTKPLHVVLLIG